MTLRTTHTPGDSNPPLKRTSSLDSPPCCPLVTAPRPCHRSLPLYLASVGEGQAVLSDSYCEARSCAGATGYVFSARVTPSLGWQRDIWNSLTRDRMIGSILRKTRTQATFKPEKIFEHPTFLRILFFFQNTMLSPAHLALAIALLSGSARAATYGLTDNYVGTSFLGGFTHENIPDPTNGRVCVSPSPLFWISAAGADRAYAGCTGHMSTRPRHSQPTSPSRPETRSSCARTTRPSSLRAGPGGTACALRA